MSKRRLAAYVMVGMLGLILGIGFLLPSTWHAERSIVVAAPAARIYPFIASFKDGWPLWSPFGQAQDPSMQMHYSGPDAGAGATQTWTQGKSGNGSMRIVRADPTTGVVYELAMDNGFSMHGSIDFTPIDVGATRVTWQDTGELGSNPLWHYVGLFLQSVVGRSFEQGLAVLKEKVEGGVQGGVPDSHPAAP